MTIPLGSGTGMCTVSCLVKITSFGIQHYLHHNYNQQHYPVTGRIKTYHFLLREHYQVPAVSVNIYISVLT